MPFAPELFSAPALQRVRDKYRHERLRSMPFFDGLMTGEVDALVDSFAGEPEVHHPVRGRIKGEPAFRHYVADTAAWLAERNADIEHVNFVVTDSRAVEEVVVHLDGDGGRIGLPFAVACEHAEDARIIELRVYFSSRPLTGRHAHRPPLLQPGLDLHAPDVVVAHQRALATGDVDAVLATFEPDGSVREPAGDAFTPPRDRRAARALCAVLLRRRRHRAASTAPSPTTAAPARWSTTSSPGAGRRSPPRRASPSTCAATAAGSPPCASTTTPTPSATARPARRRARRW